MRGGLNPLERDSNALLLLRGERARGGERKYGAALGGEAGGSCMLA